MRVISDIEIEHYAENLFRELGRFYGELPPGAAKNSMRPLVEEYQAKLIDPGWSNNRFTRAPRERYKKAKPFFELAKKIIADRPEIMGDNYFWQRFVELSRWVGLLIKDADRSEKKSKAGKKPKKAKAILCFIKKKRLENANATYKEIWDSFPEAEDPFCCQIGDDKYEVYRDGDKITQCKDKTGENRDVTYRTFEKYITSIKNNPH